MKYEDIIEIDTMIYLNAKGQICNNCDYSYETQDELYLFDINEHHSLRVLNNNI